MLVQRRAELSTVNEPSERQSVKIGVPGRLGNNGAARALKGCGDLTPSSGQSRANLNLVSLLDQYGRMKLF